MTYGETARNFVAVFTFDRTLSLFLTVMTSAHAPNNTSYSFRRFRSIRPKGSSLASPRRTNSKEQLCHWMMLFIIKLEKPHEPKEHWLRAVCAFVCVCASNCASIRMIRWIWRNSSAPLRDSRRRDYQGDRRVPTLCVCVYVCVVMVLFDVCVLSVFVEGVFWWWRAVGLRRKGGICLRRDLPLQCNIIPFSPGCCGGGEVDELGALLRCIGPSSFHLLIWLFRGSFGFSTPTSFDQSSYPPTTTHVLLCVCVCVFASEV